MFETQFQNIQNILKITNSIFAVFFQVRAFYQDFCDIFTRNLGNFYYYELKKQNSHRKVSRSSHWKCYVKKLFLKIWQISQESTCVGISF